MNEQLITELPQLLDLRIPYFDPSFEAMIRMQAKFAEEGYEKLSGVQRQVVVLYCILKSLQSHSWNSYFADNVRDDYAAGQLDAQVSLGYPLKVRLFYIFPLGGECVARNAGALDMWRKLSHEVSRSPARSIICVTSRRGFTPGENLGILA